MVKAANSQVWHWHIDQLKEIKDSLQEISETSTDIDSEVFGTLPTEVPIPPVVDTTVEAEGSQQPCYTGLWGIVSHQIDWLTELD